MLDHFYAQLTGFFGTTFFRWIRFAIVQAVIIAIAITTFNHTSWAAASVLEGPEPAQGTAEYIEWITSGRLVAMTTDIGMFVIAFLISQVKTWKDKAYLVLVFVVLAASSCYGQLLYAASHIGPFEWAEGVTTYWQNALQPLIEARVVIVPVALLSFSSLYAVVEIMLRHEDVQEAKSRVYRVRSKKGVTIEAPAAVQKHIEFFTDGTSMMMRCRTCGRVGGPYKTEQTRLSMAKAHVKKYHKKEAEAASDAAGASR